MRMIHKYMTQGMTNKDMKELQELLSKTNISQLLYITAQIINLVEVRSQGVDTEPI